MTDFPATINVATLEGTNGFRIEGVDSYDSLGFAVSDAGDVNGDGIGDVIIGAYSATRGGDIRVGESYVVFGRQGGFDAALALADLDGTNGFRLEGVDGMDLSGYSVASAGDVNGDGIDDVIVGANNADPMYAGASYVVFGSDGGFAASLDLAMLDGANGFRIEGAADYDVSGGSVSAAGDVNGDGFDDVIVGAVFADPGGDVAAGAGFVVFGTDAGFAASLDLAALDGSNGFRIEGIDIADLAGRSVSSAGDVNGDGIDDIAIGASGADGLAGAAYVVFGAVGFAASFDLATLDGTNGFVIEGLAGSDRLGLSVSDAGDVNGDGVDDLIVGAYGAGDIPASFAGGDYAGASYIIFGQTGGLGASVDLATLDGANGFRLDGANPNDFSGRSVSGAGDVNGDGFDDIIVGAQRADPGGDDYAGECYVVFGKAGGFAASIDLATLDGGNGFRVDGADADDQLGGSVSAAGDVDGDGFDDILVGAFYAGATYTGEAYVIFGRAPTTAVLRLGSDADQAIRGGDFNDTLVGRNGDDSLFGGDGKDLLRGKHGADVVLGSGGRDKLEGGGGDDRLIASAGRDRLAGGAGTDVFVLDDEVAGSDRARIMDFASGQDGFEIDAADFGGGLVAGPLDPAAFAANTTGEAEDAGDRFIYDTDSGKLFFDADGTGAGARVLIARLEGAPAIAASDFTVV